MKTMCIYTDTDRRIQPLFHLVLLSLLVAFCFALTGCAGESNEERDVAAYVGETLIYEDEITDYTSTYRSANGLEDAQAWANYLTTMNMTPQTWREDVIRKKADRILIEQRASELGITADEEAIDTRIAQMRENVGAADDDALWEEYLSQNGLDAAEMRDRLVMSSLEQQLVDAEVDLGDEVRSEMCDDYIQTNLADQVVRHYYAFEFDLGFKDQAKELLDELAGLSGHDLAARFGVDAQDGDSPNDSDKQASAASDNPDEQVSATSDSPGAQGVDSKSFKSEPLDLGWDFLYTEAAIDPDLALRKAKLASGELYRKVLTGTDAYRVVYCAERHDFSAVNKFDAISSDSLKAVIGDLTMSSQWAALLSQYLTDLETQANVQVVPMPDGLPYDVEETE